MGIRLRSACNQSDSPHAPFVSFPSHRECAIDPAGHSLFGNIIAAVIFAIINRLGFHLNLHEFEHDGQWRMEKSPFAAAFAASLPPSVFSFSLHLFGSSPLLPSQASTKPIGGKSASSTSAAAVRKNFMIRGWAERVLSAHSCCGCSTVLVCYQQLLQTKFAFSKLESNKDRDRAESEERDIILLLRARVMRRESLVGWLIMIK